MKLITKNTDYAVRALLFLAGSRQSFAGARLISQKQKIPYQFLRRILSRLIAHKLVASKEGSRGGFKLVRSPESVSLAEVAKIFQGDIKLSQCMFRKKICANRARCVLRSRIKKIEDMVSREFNGLTLAMLLKD